MADAPMVRAKQKPAQDHVEMDAVILLSILVKRGNLKPAHLQRLGYPKRQVMRRLRRLLDCGAATKSDGAYDLGSTVVDKVRKISYGIDELDGVTDFLLRVALGQSYTDRQAQEVATRILERTKVTVDSRQTQETS